MKTILERMKESLDTDYRFSETYRVYIIEHLEKVLREYEKGILTLR